MKSDTINPRFAFILLTLFLPALPATAATGTINVSGQIDQGGCMISGGKDISIVLPDADSTDFASVGDVAGQSPEYNISLSCTTGAKVMIMFNGQNDPSYNNKTVLKNSGLATGIGVQLLTRHSGVITPITLGETWTIIDNAPLYVTTTLAARYIRTGDMHGGTVVANATYDITYE